MLLHQLRFLAKTITLVCILCTGGQANELVVHAGIAPIQVGDTGVAHLPGFDPSLGILRGIHLRTEARTEYVADVENTGVDGVAVGSRGLMTIRIGNIGPIGPLYAYSPKWGHQLGSFDGVVDFAGASGVTGLSLNGVSDDVFGTVNTVHIYGNDARLRSFVGTGVQVEFEALGIGVFAFFGDASPLVSVQHLGLQWGGVEARYFYDPLPAKFCQNSGVLYGGCPCGPGSERDRGCANSVSTLGAGLELTGTPSLTADSLALVATDMPEGTCFLLQGTEFGYASTPLGDGRLCLRGSVMRISSTQVQSGSAMFPTTAGRPISSNGHVVAPSTRSYQLVYRDPLRFCTPSQLNATNGVAVLWMP